VAPCKELFVKEFLLRDWYTGVFPPATSNPFS
jgi:hypothetical protein